MGAGALTGRDHTHKKDKPERLSVAEFRQVFQSCLMLMWVGGCLCVCGGGETK